MLCLNYCCFSDLSRSTGHHTVEQFSLNLADEINTVLKLKNFKFRGNRLILCKEKDIVVKTPLLENSLISPNPSFIINFNNSVESKNN